MKKKIKEISDQPPITLKQGGAGKSRKSKKNAKESSLFAELTVRELTQEEKDRLRLKSNGLIKRMRSKDPKDKRKNELLLRQIIAYLSLEFNKVALLINF